MEQQRICEEQEMKQQIAEQKAKDKAFACCQCPEKFPSNIKLHKHIVTHYTKLPLSALAMPLSSSSVLASPTTTSILQVTFSVPPSLLASSLSAMPKLSYAAIAGTRTPKLSKIAKATFSALPTPPTTPLPLTTPKIAKATLFAAFTPLTTPKIAKPICTIPKPAAYMTIEDLFWKFAPCNI